MTVKLIFLNYCLLLCSHFFLSPPQWNTKFSLFSFRFRVLEPFMLEKIQKSTDLTLPSPSLNHVPKCPICTTFKSLQGQWFCHSPRQPVTECDKLLDVYIFPDIQYKPPLEQLEVISSCLIACGLGEVPDPCLSTASSQALLYSVRKRNLFCLSSSACSFYVLKLGSCNNKKPVLCLCMWCFQGCRKRMMRSSLSLLFCQPHSPIQLTHLIFNRLGQWDKF